jgi:bacteriocin-like protein
MKKQNVNNKLAFNKKAIAELNDEQLQEVNGGGSFDFVTAVGAYINNAGQAVGAYLSRLVNTK